MKLKSVLTDSLLLQSIQKMISFWNVAALLFCIACISKSDILRLKACNKFYAFFDVVYENSLLSNTIYSSVENISLHRCLIMCIQYPKCKSFGYMIHYSRCRIHHSSSVDNGTDLEEVVGWVHYETTKFEHNVGKFLVRFSFWQKMT